MKKVTQPRSVKMKIGFYTLSINPKNPCGSLDFNVKMVSGLAKTDPNNEYIVFVSKANRDLFVTGCLNVKLVLAGFSNERRFLRILSDHIIVPFLILTKGIDVFFMSASGGSLPLFTRKKCAYIIGMYSTHHLEQVNLGVARRLFRRFMFRMSCKKASTIVTNSLFAKRVIMKFVPQLEENKIKVIYHGIDRNFGQSSVGVTMHSNPIIEEKEKPYFLFVSVIYFYKNVHCIIEAFGKLISKYEVPHKLILVGQLDHTSGVGASYYNKLLSIAERYHCSDKIRFVGYIANNLVPLFYRNAFAYIQPSLYETFGKTTVEAFLYGCPVIASNTSATPEIVGEAGLLFDPYNPDEIMECMYKLITDDTLRAKLIEEGYRQAGKFTSEDEINAFIRVFNGVRQEC